MQLIAIFEGPLIQGESSSKYHNRRKIAYIFEIFDNKLQLIAIWSITILIAILKFIAKLIAILKFIAIRIAILKFIAILIVNFLFIAIYIAKFCNAAINCN